MVNAVWGGMLKVKTLRNLTAKQTADLRKVVKGNLGKTRIVEFGVSVMFPTGGYLRPSQRWENCLLELGWV
jgi:hypothetical protein